MGCDFSFTIEAKDSLIAEKFFVKAIDEVNRIERLISSWDEITLTAKINLQAGISKVKVNQEYIALLEYSNLVSRLTDGAFDITYASKTSCNYQDIVLDKYDATVFLPKKGMRIEFGAIGKGYAADCVYRLWQDLGVSKGIIDASGDLFVWGYNSSDPWRIAITNPFDISTHFGLVSLSKGAVVTSGDYRNYKWVNGYRESHIIDPKKHKALTDIASVTVFAPTAQLADALATAISVMGVDIGIHRVEQLDGVEAICIDRKGNFYKSSGIGLD